LSGRRRLGDEEEVITVDVPTDLVRQDRSTTFFSLMRGLVPYPAALPGLPIGLYGMRPSSTETAAELPNTSWQLPQPLLLFSCPRPCSGLVFPPSQR
jgi:hypothetical protein